MSTFKAISDQKQLVLNGAAPQWDNNLLYYLYFVTADVFIHIFAATDSIHEQNWPFPGEDPSFWKTLEILPF